MQLLHHCISHRYGVRSESRGATTRRYRRICPSQHCPLLRSAAHLICHTNRFELIFILLCRAVLMCLLPSKCTQLYFSVQRCAVPRRVGLVEPLFVRSQVLATSGIDYHTNRCNRLPHRHTADAFSFNIQPMHYRTYCPIPLTLPNIAHHGISDVIVWYVQNAVIIAHFNEWTQNEVQVKKSYY